MKTKIIQFKLKNPYKSDEIITQEVHLSEDLHFDYSKSKWIAVDAEFLGLNMQRDSICSIQIASADPESPNRQRAEIVSVYNRKATKKLKELFTSDKLKIFHVFSADVAMISKYIDQLISGPFYDTKVAAKVAWTNANRFSKTEMIKNFIDPNYQMDPFSQSLWELPVEKWTEKMIKYAIYDVLYLHPIMLKMNAIAKNRDREKILKTAMDLLPSIGELHRNGFDTDIFKF